MDSQPRSHLPQIRFFNAHLVANFSLQNVCVAGLLLEDSFLGRARLSSTCPVAISPQQNRTIKNKMSLRCNLCGRPRVAEHMYSDWYILIPCGRAADPGANLCAFRYVSADQDEAHADVNKASCEAHEIRDRWLK